MYEINNLYNCFTKILYIFTGSKSFNDDSSDEKILCNLRSILEKENKQ